jgi:hypothetical protein
MKKEKPIQKSKPNIKVIVYSLLALGFIALTFWVDWMFIIGAVVLSVLSQRELMKK